MSGDYGIGWTSNTNEEFYFDLEDYDKIKDYCWYEAGNHYIETNSYVGDKKHNLKLHRLIMMGNGFEILNLDIDHIDRNKKNNKKDNLRICSHQKNTINTGIKSNNTSGIVGVSWRKDRNKWKAEINVENKYIYLGMFSNFDDAVRTRKEAEEKYFGEYFDHNSINKISNKEGENTYDSINW